MSLFGKAEKAKIAELEKALADANDHIITLTYELRQIDTAIFQMGQQPNWDAMRPLFKPIYNAMMERKEAESSRIAKLVVPELHKTYAKESQALHIEAPSYGKEKK